MVGVAAGGGGGGGGAGAGAEAGLPGTSAALQRDTGSLVPGRTYVILVGAGGLGGQGAKRASDHGEGGLEGGYSVTTDGETLVRVFDGGARPAVGTEHEGAERAVATQSTGSNAPPAEPRFAIVDVESMMVDNVVVADDDFFAHPLVIKAVLAQRIVRRAAHDVLETRSQPAIAVRLARDERVAPRWIARSSFDLLVDPRSAQRFEPGASAADHIPIGGRGGQGGISRGPPVDMTSASLRVLAIATEWSSHHGGISTLNRELCAALAAAGHSIVCLVPGPIPSLDNEDARRRGVTLVEAAPTQGKTVGGYTCLYRRPVLPGGFTPDVIIGHGHVSGPAARTQVEDSFRSVRRVHFLHTQPGEIEWYKAKGSDAAVRSEANEMDEGHLAAGAALAVGIGPRLHRELQRLVHPSLVRPESLELDPGLGGDDSTRTLPPTSECLFLGRTEDVDLKGLDVVAHSVKHARECGIAGSLTVRGSDPRKARELHDRLSAVIGVPNTVRVYPFDADPAVVRSEMLRASLVLMPSRSEGFGLAAWEAIGLAVPVLVSDQSGVAELLKREVPALAQFVVVPMAMDDSATYRAWGERVTHVLRERDAAFRRAAELRKALRPKFTWKAAVETFVEAVRRT
jgi:glycosyltransferase involved in cell wall biosynthesis